VSPLRNALSEPINGVQAQDILSGMPDPDSVRRLESFLVDFPQVDLGVTHVVHGGMCARTGMIPAGTLLTGALTNCDNICVIYGDITVTTDDGIRRLVGFNVLPANAGAKRAGIAHADTWWSTILKTDKTDVCEIEDQMTGESSSLLTRRGDIAYAAPPAQHLEK